MLPRLTLQNRSSVVRPVHNSESEDDDAPPYDYITPEEYRVRLRFPVHPYT
jgi:hypothetical protein